MSNARKTIPKAVETRVLVACRRHCCLCWHLKRDEADKPGQIAHLDRNPSNNAEDNLVWLCLPHHEEFDRTSRQAKSITEDEVRHARAELWRHMNQPSITPCPGQGMENQCSPAEANILFNQSKQQVGQQFNIAGDAHLIVNSPIPHPLVGAKSHPATKQCRAAKKKGPASRAVTKTQSNCNAQAVYAFVVERVRRVLKANPKLVIEMEKALRSKLPSKAKAAADIVEMVFTAGLNEVLAAVYLWLETQTTRDDTEAIREMLDGLGALGADVEWVAKARSFLSRTSGKLRGGHVSVPRETEMATAEMLKAAIRDGPCIWQKTRANPLPVGDGGFDASVEPSSPILRSRIEEFRNYLLKKCFIQADDPDANKKLEEHLKVRWQQRKPLYALFNQVGGLPQHMAKEKSIPWHYLIVMQQDPAVLDVLEQPRAVAVWLKDILNEVERLEHKNPLR